MTASSLHPLQLLRQSSKFAGGTLLGMGLNVAASLYVAHRLGPELLGRVAFVTLWLSYAGLTRLGFLEGAVR